LETWRTSSEKRGPGDAHRQGRLQLFLVLDLTPSNLATVRDARTWPRISIRTPRSPRS